MSPETLFFRKFFRNGRHAPRGEDPGPGAGQVLRFDFFFAVQKSLPEALESGDIRDFLMPPEPAGPGRALLGANESG